MTAKTFIFDNTTAIALPKDMVEQYHLSGEVDIIPTVDGVLIKSANIKGVPLRQQWATLFAKAREEGRLPLAEETGFIENDFDKNDWTWPGL